MSEAWTAEHGTLSLWKGVVGPRVDTRTLRQIAEDVAATHGLTLEEMKAPTSARRISHPRQEAMAAMRATGRYSLSQIGGFFSLHHSSALHGARAHEARVAGGADLVTPSSRRSRPK